MILIPIAVSLLFVLLVVAYLVAVTRIHRDAYDLAVEWLTENWSDENLAVNWRQGSRTNIHDSPASILFRCIDKTGRDMYVGCLTSFKQEGGNKALQVDHPFRDKLLNDKIIPSGWPNITPAMLPHFAKWQRKIDKLYNRTPPAWVGAQK